MKIPLCGLKILEIYCLTPQEFEDFKWGVYHLELFTSETGRPPMSANQFVLLFQISFGCKLPISKVSKLRRSDIDLNEKVVLSRNNKNGKLIKIPIRNNDYVKLHKYLQGMFSAQRLFPIAENTVRKYAKDAMRLSGLTITTNQAKSIYPKVVNSRKNNSRFKIKKIMRAKKPRKLTPAQEKKCWDLNPHMCNLCGKQLTGISETEFDHTKAFTKGGNTDLTNVKLSHRSCNNQKGIRSLKTARKMLGYHKNIKKTRIEMNLVKKKRVRIRTRNDFTLEKFFENGKEYVRILHPRKTIEACLILCNKEHCKWWNDNSMLPRHIQTGGGGNVLLPQDAENANPMIIVMSGKHAIRKMKLKDMVLTHS